MAFKVCSWSWLFLLSADTNYFVIASTQGRGFGGWFPFNNNHNNHWKLERGLPKKCVFCLLRILMHWPHWGKISFLSLFCQRFCQTKSQKRTKIWMRSWVFCRKFWQTNLNAKKCEKNPETMSSVSSDWLIPWILFATILLNNHKNIILTFAMQATRPTIRPIFGRKLLRKRRIKVLWCFWMEFTRPSSTNVTRWFILAVMLIAPTEKKLPKKGIRLQPTSLNCKKVMQEIYRMVHNKQHTLVILLTLKSMENPQVKIKVILVILVSLKLYKIHIYSWQCRLTSAESRTATVYSQVLKVVVVYWGVLYTTILFYGFIKPSHSFSFNFSPCSSSSFGTIFIDRFSIAVCQELKLCLKGKLSRLGVDILLIFINETMRAWQNPAQIFCFYFVLVDFYQS